jgi:hypothetical protein
MEQSKRSHTVDVPFGYIPTELEIEAARTDLAVGITGPILLLGLVVIGTHSPAAGLVVMIALFTIMAIYFAVKGSRP